MPPPLGAELPEMVLLRTVNPPAPTVFHTYRPPPPPTGGPKAELPDTVLFSRSRLNPESLRLIPPPLLARATLLATVLLRIVTMADDGSATKTPPPPSK